MRKFRCTKKHKPEMTLRIERKRSRYRFEADNYRISEIKKVGKMKGWMGLGGDSIKIKWALEVYRLWGAKITKISVFDNLWGTRR